MSTDDPDRAFHGGAGVHLARVQRTGGDGRSPVLSIPFLLLLNVLTGFGPVILFLGSVAIAIGPLILLAANAIPRQLSVVVLCLIAFVVGSVMAIMHMIVFVCYSEWPYCRVLPGRLARRLRRRGELRIPLEKPETRFVELVPRANWNRLMLDTAVDVAFVRLDPVKREIVFQGDRYLIEIPAEAIVACYHDVYQPIGNFTSLQMIMLVIQTEQGTLELAANFRDYAMLEIFPWRRRKLAQDMIARIQALNPRAARENIPAQMYLAAEMPQFDPSQKVRKLRDPENPYSTWE